MSNANTEIPLDDQFESEYRMFVPLTIDDMEVDDTNYFFNGTKLLLLALGILPYFGIFFILDAIPSITVFVVITILYLFIFSFYARFLVFEEGKQRGLMRELENNKHSDMAYFWEWDKIGIGKRDNGLAYIQSDGATLRRAYIVKVDSGSDVGVPKGNYRNFRQTQQDFLRSMYQLGMDVKVYNIRKRPGLSTALRDYSSMLKDLDRDEQVALIKLSQLNIDINFLYSRTKDQRYITYYLVVNKRIENLTSFRDIINDTIGKTFGANISFYNPHIMDKPEVDNFLAEYYDVDAVNAAGIHKMNGFKDLNDYVELVAIYDKNGQAVPFSIYDDMNTSIGVSIGGSTTLDELVESQEKEDEKWESRRQRSYDKKETELMRLRREDKISYEEYKERLDRLKWEHEPENFNEEVELTEAEREKRRIRQEEEQLKAERQEKLRRKKQLEKKKWYERDMGKELQPKGVVVNKRQRKKRVVHDDGMIEWDAQDIATDDLKGDTSKIKRKGRRTKKSILGRDKKDKVSEDSQGSKGRPRNEDRKRSTRKVRSIEDKNRANRKSRIVKEDTSVDTSKTRSKRRKRPVRKDK